MAQIQDKIKALDGQVQDAITHACCQIDLAIWGNAAPHFHSIWDAEEANGRLLNNRFIQSRIDWENAANAAEKDIVASNIDDIMTENRHYIPETVSHHLASNVVKIQGIPNNVIETVS